MIFIILTILSSLAISIILTWNERRGGTRLVVAGANYIVATILGLLLGGIPSQRSALWLTVAVAVGIGFVLGFLFLMRAIREAGLAITASVARIATIGPALLAVFVYDDPVTPTSTAGIVIGLLSFVLLGIGSPNRNSDSGTPHIRAAIPLLLLTLFAIMTANDFSMKVVQENGLELNHFLTVVFGTAGLLCWGIVGAWKKKEKYRIRTEDVLRGSVLGIPNYMSSWFLIHALNDVSAAIVFPIVSAGGVIVSTGAAVLLFCERPTLPSWCGILLAVVAVVLLGLGT